MNALALRPQGTFVMSDTKPAACYSQAGFLNDSSHLRRVKCSLWKVSTWFPSALNQSHVGKSLFVSLVRTVNETWVHISSSMFW